MNNNFTKGGIMFDARKADLGPPAKKAKTQHSKPEKTINGNAPLTSEMDHQHKEVETKADNNGGNNIATQLRSSARNVEKYFKNKADEELGLELCKHYAAAMKFIDKKISQLHIKRIAPKNLLDHAVEEADNPGKFGEKMAMGELSRKRVLERVLEASRKRVDAEIALQEVIRREIIGKVNTTAKGRSDQRKQISHGCFDNTDDEEEMIVKKEPKSTQYHSSSDDDGDPATDMFYRLANQ